MTAACPLTRDGWSDELRDAYADLLGQFHWQWFANLTFRDDKHPEAAFKCFRYFVCCLNRRLYGRNWARRGQSVYWVCALEWQRRGVVHFHALLAAESDLNVQARRLTWMDFWYGVAGIARIYSISEVDDRQRRLVNAYVGKYVSKGGSIDVSENLKDYAHQKGLGIPIA